MKQVNTKISAKLSILSVIPESYEVTNNLMIKNEFFE